MSTTNPYRTAPNHVASRYALFIDAREWVGPQTGMESFDSDRGLLTGRIVYEGEDLAWAQKIQPIFGERARVFVRDHEAHMWRLRFASVTW
jgi:hypothetical protein